MGPSSALNSASDGVVCFGVFEDNLRSGELRKNGVKIKIQDLPFRALNLLLSRPNEIIRREEFRRALWPDGVFVDFDSGISNTIKRLRDALGDSADNPIFIETVDRRGYRWIAPVRSRHQSTEAGLQPNAQSNGLIPGASPRPTSPTLKLIFVLPVPALLFAAWISRPNYRPAKAGPNPHPATSPFSSAGLPRPAANREAEEFYLQGRYYWEKRTPDSLNKAVDSFTQSLVHDPGYAPA